MKISKNQEICGWGCNNYAKADILNPANIKEIKDYVRLEKQTHSIITRGLGRSYGDAAQLNNKSVLKILDFKDFYLDEEKNLVTASAGISFNDLLLFLIPRGYFLPVSPGTKNVTLGGAIASDVHGKNHHLDGSFGNHLQEIKLIDGQGKIRQLFPNNIKNKDNTMQFWATVGGMGLTGIIIEAKFFVFKIETALMSVDTTRHSNINSLMEAMIKADKSFKYSVAWVDSLDKNGKGVLTTGNHARLEEITSNKVKNYLEYKPQTLAKTPNLFPGGILNKFTVSAFNQLWFQKAPQARNNELQQISTFFHPLDGIKNWNKIYGKNGFYQYQFVVPDNFSELIPTTLERLREANAPSFLTVLKRFGRKNNGLLSFPIEGWTLAVDIPANVQNILETLNELDQLIANAGGRIYLAKDMRQSSEIFKRTYPKFCEWQAIKKIMDPNDIFCSDIYKRLI